MTFYFVFLCFLLIMILGLERSHCPNKVVSKFLCDSFGKIATLVFYFVALASSS